MFFLGDSRMSGMKQLLRLPGLLSFSAFLDFSTKIMLAAGVTMGVVASALAQPPGAHVHGKAALDIAVDSGTVQLNLYSPLDNLLGFEHAPRTGEERRAIQAMTARLHQADSLFVFTPSARCRLESANLRSAILPPELLAVVPSSGKSQDAPAGHRKGEASKPVSSSSPSSPAPHTDEAHRAHEAHENHAELEAAWVFHCSTPQALQELDVGLFRAFPSLRRLDVAVAGPRKQSSARLTPQSSTLKWQ